MVMKSRSHSSFILFIWLFMLEARFFTMEHATTFLIQRPYLLTPHIFPRSLFELTNT